MSAAWLDQAKEELAKSDEWKLVMNSIYESVQASLKRNKTKHFADLTAEERAVVMAQVELELTQETAYTTFLRAVSRVVDTHLAVHVDNLFVQPSNHATKQTLAMQTAADAAGRLVQSLPLEQRSLLRLLFNQPFPPSFRCQAWKLFLADPTSRFKYEQLCLTNRISTISVLDTQLTHQSQAALEAFPSLPNTRDTLIAMKTALSYLHTCNSSILQEMDAAFFKLILPLLAVWLPEADVSSLVEAYSAFLALPRPKSRTSCDLVVGHVVRRLDAVDPSIARSLTALFPTEISSSASWLGILQPYIDYVFVGVVKLDVLLFIWDQCFLVGHDRLLPELCAAVLALVFPHWSECKTFQELQTCLASMTPCLDVIQVQAWIDEHCAASIRQDLQLQATSTHFYDPYVPTATPRSSRSPSTSSAQANEPNASVSPSESPPVENAFTCHLDDMRTALATVFGGTDETQRSMDEQGDALLAAALGMSCPNGFANVLNAFHDTLHQVFTGDAVLYDHAAQLEDEVHVQVLQESQKAVYGRVFSPQDIAALSGKAKLAYDKKLSKLTATYTQKLAKMHK